MGVLGLPLIVFGQGLQMKPNMSGTHPFAPSEPRQPGEVKTVKIEHALLVLLYTSSSTLIPYQVE